MTASKQIVTVWLDETSDDQAWIVDVDIDDSGESRTLRAFPPSLVGQLAAKEFAADYAKRHGLEVAR